MNFENITQSERSDSQQTVGCFNPFIGNVQNGQIYKDRNPRAGGRGNWGKWRERLLMEMGFLWGVMKLF